MKLEQYISQLLYRYQCVTIPGFGAFLSEIQSAQLNKETHSFSPPTKQISFNAYLKNNDGLLANHIATCEKITYSTAVANIENEVLQLKNDLQNIGYVTLQNIGQIKINAEKNWVFTPIETTNYLTSSFGLSSYVSPAVKREVYKQEVAVLEEKAPIVFTPEKREEQEEKRTFNFLKYAAIFLLGATTIATGLYFGNEYYEQKIEQETLAIQTNVQKKVNQKLQEATFVLPTTLPNVTLSEESTSKPYHIVAGSFKQEENANKMYNKLLELGYNAEKKDKNQNQLYPVYYGSYSSYTEAEQMVQKIKKEHNPEAWLLIEE